MKERLIEKKAIKYLEKYSQKNISEGNHAEYASLQLSWNRDILERSVKWIPKETNKAIGIGSFQGALETALSHFFNKVICVDQESFLPKWKPNNMFFHQADIDTNDWKLPDEEAMFDVAFLVETIEHLIWSPLQLLKWMKTYSHISVISTPDDQEWPPMPIRPWTRYQNFMSIPSSFPGAKGNPEPMYHSKQYNQAEFIQMLDFIGFRVLEFFRTGEGKHQMVAICSPRKT